MRSEKTDSPILDTTSRLSALSIVIDDFDSVKESSSCSSDTSTSSCSVNTKEEEKQPEMPEVSLYQPQQRLYSRQSSDASIKKILEEAEHRKHEFWKLIDEHSAVIENLKKIEQQENSVPVCKISPTPGQHLKTTTDVFSINFIKKTLKKT